LHIGVNSGSSRLSVSRAIKYCFTAQSASPQCLRWYSGRGSDRGGFAVCAKRFRFLFAAGIALVAVIIAALPVLLWPLARRPAELLQVSA
jgi:hypothetical protein